MIISLGGLDRREESWPFARACGQEKQKPKWTWEKEDKTSSWLVLCDRGLYYVDSLRHVILWEPLLQIFSFIIFFFLGGWVLRVWGMKSRFEERQVNGRHCIFLTLPKTTGQMLWTRNLVGTHMTSAFLVGSFHWSQMACVGPFSTHKRTLIRVLKGPYYAGWAQMGWAIPSWSAPII